MAFVRADEVLVFALLRYRYLRSGQLAALSDRSVQVVRRRMRELVRLGYAVTLERISMHELVYALGPKGWDHVAKELKVSPNKLPYSRSNSRSAETIFLQHTLLTNDVRIAFDRALAEHPHVALRRAIPEWEMAESVDWEKLRKSKKSKAAKTTKKYLLAENMEYRVKGKKKTIRFRPDCLFLIYTRRQGPNYSAAFFLESDRSSEPIASKIHEKYLSYMLYFQKRRFNEVWGAGKMRVLFVVERGNPTKRIARMQAELQAMADELGDREPVEGSDSKAAFVHAFRFCDASDLNEQTVVDGKIWTDWQGRAVALYEPSHSPRPEGHRK